MINLVHFFTRRLLLAAIQVLLVATIVFSFLHMMPGDPVLLVLGTDRAPDPAAVVEMRHKLGLDQPVLKQYTTWVGNMATLNFGSSIFDGESIKNYISVRLPRTIELSVVSIIIAILIGVPIGIIAALRRGSIVDVLLTSSTVLGISLPVYVVGTLLVIIFGINLKWLPASGYVAFSKDPIQHILRLILPTITLAFGLSTSIARMTRSSLLEVLNKEYIQTVRAKGLDERGVIYKHAFRNALIPVVTVVGLQLGNLMGGTVLIEYLFNWPGLSTLLVTAVSRRDYPLVQGSILVISALFIFINLFVDILYGILDPKVR